MKKIQVFFLLMTVSITNPLYSQAPKWIVGNSLLGFSNSAPPQIMTNSIGPGGPNSPSSNAAFDSAGELLFYVRGGLIYDKNNVFKGNLYVPINTESKETAIVNVPGSCNEFYVIAMSSYPLCINCTNSIIYNRITVNGTSFSISQPQFIGNRGERSFAISKLRRNRTRFLFAVGGNTVERFLIDKYGILPQQTLINYAENNPSDVELYEDTNTGNMKLAWGDNAGLKICKLDQNGNLLDYSTPFIQGVGKVHGIEFINYNKILIAQNNSNVANKGIAIINTAGILPTSNFISNTEPYYNSYIEKAVDGNFYVSKENIISNTVQGYKLASISPTSQSVTEVSNLVIPTMEESSLTRLLPDQIDFENYSTANYRWDLAAFDNFFDTGEEPYVPTQGNETIWSSNDIWNRKSSNGLSLSHENPGYSSDPAKWNVMRFRIRNIGCEASQESRVRLYWTMGATGESWDNNVTPLSPPSSTALNSWDGSKCIMTPITNNCIPAGGEISMRSTVFNSNAPEYDNINPNTPGFIIPPLQPGQEIIIDAKWQPVEPSLFGDPNIISNPVICFLGRIDDANDPMYLEIPASTMNTLRDNVRNNNNIVTRNTALVPLGIFEGMYYQFGGSIFIGNYMSQEEVFNINLNKISGSGTNFENIGRIKINLDDILWNKWVEAGNEGEGVEISDHDKHEIRITNFDHAQLNNITLSPGEYRAIKFSFELKQPTDVVQDYVYSVSQSLINNIDQNYGSVCNFNVTINQSIEKGEPIYESANKPASLDNITNSNLTEAFKISPNPSSDFAKLDFDLLKANNLTIQIFDINGKMVKMVENNKLFESGLNTVTFSTIELLNGNYFVVVFSNNERKSIQLIIKH
ncbi:T9SS type A sorting domain-containing protein [Chryseobacterium camelliae]|uniref:T9SS type A sorting domain-containing protein n=1 Tax=Chryseobacterium camelliae TaxID=1265445 RepID=A0ABY7QKF4_9FLAO|nr:T9SS type A sorting domain-containing protein [Chryseobacterium camelliae]WBV60125.1 T9SS type A sorting domain-containing protein [Chryseobacterium camelliae]